MTAISPRNLSPHNHQIPLSHGVAVERDLGMWGVGAEGTGIEAEPRTAAAAIWTMELVVAAPRKLVVTEATEATAETAGLGRTAANPLETAANPLETAANLLETAATITEIATTTTVHIGPAAWTAVLVVAHPPRRHPVSTCWPQLQPAGKGAMPPMGGKNSPCMSPASRRKRHRETWNSRLLTPACDRVMLGC